LTSHVELQLQKWHPACENLCHLLISTEVLFWNKCRKKTEVELANPGSPGNGQENGGDDLVASSLLLLKQLECGSVPNVMAALPNIGGALCSTPQFG